MYLDHVWCFSRVFSWKSISFPVFFVWFLTSFILLVISSGLFKTESKGVSE